MKEKDFEWLQSWLKVALNCAGVEDFVDVVDRATDAKPPPIEKEME